MDVWNKTGSHHSLQSDYLSHGSTRLLRSAIHNWNLGTQDQKKKFLCVDEFEVKYFSEENTNHLLDFLKSTIQFQQIERGEITSD